MDKILLWNIDLLVSLLVWVAKAVIYVVVIGIDLGLLWACAILVVVASSFVTEAWRHWKEKRKYVNNS